MRAVLVALALLATAPAAAGAATRYASPGGVDAEPCDAGHPCQINRAVGSAMPNDEVILQTGDYGSPGIPLPTSIVGTAAGLDVHGEDGKPRPRIFTNALNGVDLRGAGDTARHFEVQQLQNANNQHAFIFDGSQASDLVVKNTNGSGGKACTLLDTSTLIDSVCEATGTDGAAIYPYVTNGSPGIPRANHSVIRNVTAVASGMSGLGVLALGGNAAGDVQDLTVSNTIIVVPTGAVAIQATKQMGGDATITIDHSNFGFQSATGGGKIVKGQGNQQLGPKPTFASALDYHQAAGSPTIDAGTTSPANGDTDFDGDPRALGAGGTDIGADEFVPAPAVTTGDPTSVTASGATLNGTVNPEAVATSYQFEYGTTTEYGATTTAKDAGAGVTDVAASASLTGLAPATTYHYRLVGTSRGGTTPGADRTLVTSALPGGGGGGGSPHFVGPLTLTPTTFRAAPKGPSVRAARRHQVGTRAGFKLDLAAVVSFRVERKLAGRRSRVGCVKPTKALRHARRCTRLKRVRGSFTVPGALGQTNFRFTGRLKGKRLPAGRYRLTASVGKPVSTRRASFRVVRR